MVRHQRVGCPASLKHGFVHGPSAAGCPRLPHLGIIEPLQRFIRTQEQARHIPTDMVKALSPNWLRAFKRSVIADNGK
jgi:hypothetical protein